MTDKEWLLELADKLSQTAQWIQIDSSVARAWATRLRAIAEKEDGDD